MKLYILIIAFLLTATSSFAQLFGRKYTTGTYYTTDGQKRTGLIAMDFDPPSLFGGSDNQIFFKTDTGAEREKIKVSTIKAFTVTNKDTARTDSFVIINKQNLSRIKYKHDIIQVIYNNGPLKLYNYRMQRKAGFGLGVVGVGVTYYDNYYFYGSDIDNVTEMNRKDFKRIMSSMLADDPGLVLSIQNGEYTIKDMHVMLARYYAQYANTAPQAVKTQ